MRVELDTQCDGRTWFPNEVPKRVFGSICSAEK